MGPLWVPRFTVYTNPVKNECLCGVHYNPMCLLLTPLLSPIIIWMAEMLFLLGEKHLLFLSIFPAVCANTAKGKFWDDSFHQNFTLP